MTQVLILGAGAVGSALGGYLARGGHDVTLVARPPHVEAIHRQGGLRVVAYDESFLAPVTALAAPPAALHDDALLFLTVQAHDVAAALGPAVALAARRPLVTWQNGIRAEATAAALAPRIYGGVVRFTSTMLDPGEVRLRRPGQLVVGRHPSGADDTARFMVALLAGAGFTAAVSPDIRRDKALKLLVNLVSGPVVLYRRTDADPALARLQVALLEEARAVFAAEGIVAEPASGLGETLESMLRHFRAGGSAPDGRPVYNSTWQNLHHHRPVLENRFYHEEILALGRRHGIPAPVNARVLEVLEGVRARGLGPEPFDRAGFIAAFASVLDLERPADAPALPPPSPPLEI